jgi:hypothetical protein
LKLRSVHWFEKAITFRTAYCTSNYSKSSFIANALANSFSATQFIMSDKIDFPLLNNHNYHEWKDHAMSLLQSKQLYRLVTGLKLRPTSPGDKQNDWDDQQEAAAGLLARMVDRQSHHHFQEYKSDPVRIWDILKRLNTAVAPGMRFNAYDDIVGMRKKDDETLEDFGNRVTNAMQKVKDI